MRAQTHNSNYSEQRKQTIIEIEPHKRKKNSFKGNTVSSRNLSMQTKEKEKERKKPFKSGNVLSYLH